MKAGFEIRVEKALESLRAKGVGHVQVGLVTGTGLGMLADDIKDVQIISYGNIDEFPMSTAPGHSGVLHVGTLGGQSVAMLAGRFHLYEGWEAEDIVLPIYVLRALGAKTLILTNAAGTVNPDWNRGDIAVIEDHINLQGVHALAGPNSDNLGVRFPDMSTAYDADLRSRVTRLAEALRQDLHSGIYTSVHGPELETNAERRYIRTIGGDLVGMSTVLECIAANHAGMKVVGLSAITNKATGAPDQMPDLLEDILQAAGQTAPKLHALIVALLEDLSKG